MISIKREALRELAMGRIEGSDTHPARVKLTDIARNVNGKVVKKDLKAGLVAEWERRKRVEVGQHSKPRAGAKL